LQKKLSVRDPPGMKGAWGLEGDPSPTTARRKTQRVEGEMISFWAGRKPWVYYAGSTSSVFRQGPPPIKASFRETKGGESGFPPALEEKSLFNPLRSYTAKAKVLQEVEKKTSSRDKKRLEYNPRPEGLDLLHANPKRTCMLAARKKRRGVLRSTWAREEDPIGERDNFFL